MKELKPAPTLSDNDLENLAKIDDLRKDYEALKKKRAQYQGYLNTVCMLPDEYFLKTSGATGIAANSVRVLLSAGIEVALGNLDKQIMNTVLEIEGKINP